MTAQAYQAASLIQQQAPGFHPRVGIVLGSGLSSLVDLLDHKQSISYDTLPCFPKVSVQGHLGQLTLGTLKGTPVVCLQGRSHSYEMQGFDVIKTYVRTLKLLGCEYFIATNASGSLHADMIPGELMLLTDHLNFQGSNPLVGPNDEEFGPRFLPLDNAYDKSLRDRLLQVAEKQKIKLHQGTYACVMGPSYETAAEIRAFKTLGADAVGMSTVPEVLVANHCGMKVAAIASITNFATGLASFSHSHTEVIAMANQAVHSLMPLLAETVGELGA